MKTSPIQKFLKIESLSGFLLIGTTLIALIWANSPFEQSYFSIWKYRVGITSGDFQISKSLLLWINDGLMAVFFFLLGLEIKRELTIGELNSPRKAAFPFFAAIGGMIIPASIFFFLNQSSETMNGWGITMATDIAFSLAILSLISKHVPLNIKIFLTAFAIVDDIGAVIIIAIFYSADIQWNLILYALLIISFLIALGISGVYNKFLFIPLSIIVWILFLKSGIHPTLAGVLLAIAIPIRQKIDVHTFSSELTFIVEKIRSSPSPNPEMLSKEQIRQLDNLEDLNARFQSPLQHLEHKLHGWVAFFIIPLFAFANAGLSFKMDMGVNFDLAVYIAVSLILGKLLGVFLFSWLSVKLGFASLPDDVNWLQILGTGFLAGVGFTMSIFIANLAFAGQAHLIDSSKLGIFAGSFLSGVLAIVILRFARKKT